MSFQIIKNGLIVNEGKISEMDILIKDDIIVKIDKNISQAHTEVIDAQGQYILPGVIDDQVHFREPGLTHKATIYSESRAAVAGGTTSFMEMPNTIPNAVTQEELQKKYDIGAKTSLANYSFFMGGTNSNIEEILKTNSKNVCGIKLFLGSSTGDMLVDNEQILERIFSKCPHLIATHCEDEATIKHNLELFKSKYGDHINSEMHPLIRSHEACYLSSSKAIALAKKHNTRLHILHISTANELELFEDKELTEKHITAEVCVHHLHFTSNDYSTLGNQIKCNPAIKNEDDKAALWKALLTNKLDIIATDHAPHTWHEKQLAYLQAPSGLPLVQHSLLMMLDYVKQGKMPLTYMVQKMCHNPALLFHVEKRGFIREGYYADLVMVNPNKNTRVSKSNILYQCAWSPLEGKQFDHEISKTWVNGNMVYSDGKIQEIALGKRLLFTPNN